MLRGVSRGPEQIVSGEERRPARPGKKEFREEVTDEGRAALGQLLEEAMGDHVLMLRLFQVCAACVQKAGWQVWAVLVNHRVGEPLLLQSWALLAAFCKCCELRLS